MSTRNPAVAGMFYPGNADELRQMLKNMLQHAQASQSKQFDPHALIVPHAGYIYSGEIAASGYHHLKHRKHEIKRVLLLGPSHRVPLRGAACPTTSQFSTPLGLIDIDQEAIQALLEKGLVSLRDDAHAMEHSLEVHLPYLQYLLQDFTLVPIVVGLSQAQDIADILNHFWEDTTTLIVVSSDLSHYLDYSTAKSRDSHTTTAFEALDFSNIGPEDACGYYPVSGLLLAAKQHHCSLTTVDLRNSGDTAGSRDQVVGYGAYVIE